VARPYSDEFLRFLADTRERTLGIELAKLCVKANIPASHVAKALEASRMTVYGWFRGRDIRAKKRKAIEVFMDIVRQDLEMGTLPAKNPAEARSYIATMIGVEP
jgi:hypothetical protein